MTNTNILSALVQAELEMQSPTRDKVNTHFNSPYSSLDSLIRSVKTVLLKNGIKMKIDLLESEDKAGAKITLYHVSGEILQGETCWIPVEKEKNMRHAYGKSYTYAQRYAIASFFSLSEAIETDNDGNCDDDKKTTMRVKKNVNIENRTEVCGAQTDLSRRHDDEQITRARKWMFGKCNELGIDNDARKQIIKRATGKDSSTQLTLDEYKVLRRVIMSEYASSA